jgi:predicted enzyme related to lactoylglutathione lyase
MADQTTVTGVDFVTVFVKDFPEAQKFYGEALGLEQSSNYERIPGGEFETGTLTLQVLDSAAIGREFAPSGHPIALHVGDVHAAREELESKGVRFFADTMDTGVCHMAHFADPSGNALMFHNRYAPRGGYGGTASSRSRAARSPARTSDGSACASASSSASARRRPAPNPRAGS